VSEIWSDDYDNAAAGDAVLAGLLEQEVDGK